MLTIFADNEKVQEQVGAALALQLVDGLIIHLNGNLGAGKTTLVRGMLRALGHIGAVKSPTYTLIEPYEIGGKKINHFDLYRLADPEELEYLGIRDMLAEHSVMLFEWPDLGVGVVPKADLDINIEYHSDGRKLSLVGHTEVGLGVIEGVSDHLPL